MLGVNKYIIASAQSSQILTFCKWHKGKFLPISQIFCTLTVHYSINIKVLVKLKISAKTSDYYLSYSLNMSFISIVEKKLLSLKGESTIWWIPELRERVNIFKFLMLHSSSWLWLRMTVVLLVTCSYYY